ncbi:MAG: hypothetical protein PHC61_12825 [Chitinivibrionales bacterium]|nr:hypothetical protein [Chitinivibrionales bacterium]
METIPWPEDGGASLQIWRYDPALLTNGESVDKLSLYLSLSQDPDERIAKAGEQLIKGITWLKA